MAVRWPDGSLTGSVRVSQIPELTPVVPEPEETTPDKGSTKEVKDGAR